MGWALGYREGQFTPGEAVHCTGLPLTLQRNWRSQGFLPVKTTGQKRFSPRELATIRVMVLLRNLGIGLLDSRAAADEVATSLLFIALTNCEQSVEVEAETERGTRYKEALRWELTDECQHAIAGLDTAAARYIIIEDGQCMPVPELRDTITNHETESFALIDLEAVAAALVRAAPRPLFTLVPPHNFR